MPWLIETTTGNIYYLGCASPYFLNQLTQSCETDCPEYLEKDVTNRICINCQKNGRFFILKNCYVAANCAALLGVDATYINEANHCKCASYLKPSYTTLSPITRSTVGICVVACTSYNLVLSNFNCESCADINAGLPLFNENTGTCVAQGTNSCPSGTLESAVNKACIKCSNISGYGSLSP